MKNFLLLIFLIPFVSVFSQYCGNPAKQNIITPFKTDPASLTVKDRFGNSFDFEEIKLPSTMVAPTGATPLSLPYQTTPAPCQAGLFTIYFAPDAPGFGFDIDSNRTVVCQVFKDISRLLHDINPSNTGRVKIWIASNAQFTSLMQWPTVQNGSVVALASAFQVIPSGLSHSLLDNEVAKTIKGGKNSYIGIPTALVPFKSDSLFHGYMGVNFSDNNWYKNFKSNAIGTNQNDLYSTVLHEAFHLLGLSSELKENGSAKKGANLYSLVDQFYTIGNSQTSRVLYNTITNSSDIWTYAGSVASLAQGCGNSNSIYFNGFNLTGQAVYSGSSWEQGSSLSHLSCHNAGGCSGYAKNFSPPNDYIMAHCGDKGVHFLKRQPNFNEVKMLCDLGYSLKSLGSVYAFGDDTSNTTVYKTYTNCSIDRCYAIGFMDGYHNTPHNTAKVFSISTLLANDGNAGAMDTVFKVIPSYAGTAKIVGTNLVFTPSNNYIGQSIIGYYPKCSSTGIRGSISYVFVYVNYPTILPCNTTGYCNMLCNGDFELGTNPYVYSDMLITNRNTGTPELGRTDNGKTCFWTPIGFTGWCDSIAPTQQCSVNPYTLRALDGKQFVMINGYGGNLATALLFKLDKPMLAGNTYALTVLGRKLLATCPNSRIEIFGDSVPPCPRANGSPTSMDGTPDACGFRAKSFGFIQIDTNDWKKHTHTINPTSKISYIILYTRGDYPGTAIAERLALLDKVELYKTNTPKVVVTATPSTIAPCIDSAGSISYKVCLDVTTNNADSIVVQLNLPMGINIASTSSFNTSGKYVIPANTINSTNCVTLTLNYSFGASVSPNFPYNFDILATSNGLCQSTSSDERVVITPITNTLTYTSNFNDTSSYFGDTITHYFKVCNTGDRVFDKLQLIMDSIPSSYKVLDSNGFKKFGNQWSKLSNIPAAISGQTVCYIDSIILIVSGCGNSTLCSRISQGQNSCVKNSYCSAININKLGRVAFDPKFPEICQNIPTEITANTTPSCTNCSYEWKFNGNVRGSTKTDTFSPLGVYYVKITQANGCVSHIDSVELTRGKDTIKSNAVMDTLCSNYLGKISLNPSIGVPPYKYLWNTGSKDSFIDSLVPSTYIVRVTDINGCSDYDTFSFQFKTDTLQVNTMVQNSTCGIANGAIWVTPHHSISPYSISWADNSNLTNFARFDLASGNYSATVTDGRGCTRTFQFVLTNADTIHLSGKNVIDTIYYVRNYANVNTKTLIFSNLQNTIFRAGIVVDSGYKLEIINNSVLEFGENAMIEVANKGVLKVTNSILKSTHYSDSCNAKWWQGIRVFPYKITQANPTGAFWPFALTPLEITNSTISHAQIGVKSGFSYNSGDALGWNGQPVIIEHTSHNVKIQNSNFINNAEAVVFATEFYNGGYLHFQGNKVEQTNSKYIQPYKTMVDIYYYQTPLRPPLATASHPVWDWQLRIHNNRITTMQDYTNYLHGVRLQLGKTGDDCDCVVSDDLNFKHNKISNFSTGIKMAGSRFYTFVYDTLEQCQTGMEINRFEAIRVDSSLFDYNVVGINFSTVGAKNYPYEWGGKYRTTVIANSSFNGINGNNTSYNNIAAKAIYLSNVKDANIFNNLIAQGSVQAGDNVSSYTGVHLNKTTDVKVYENAFTNPSGAVNSVTAAAFFSENNATNVNAFSKNTIAANYHVGAWVWGENRNLRMRCNQFNTPASAAILVQGNLRDQGMPDGVDSTTGCDKDYYPAANTFEWLTSHSSNCGVSFETAIKVDTAKSNFRFYYNTQSKTGPTFNTPQTPDPLCITNTYGDKEWKYNACAFSTAGGKFGPTTCDNGNIFNIVKPPHEDVPCEEVIPYIDSFQWRVVDYRGSLTELLGGYHDFVHLADRQRVFHGLLKESKDLQVSIRRKCPDTLPILRDYLEESPFWEDRVELVEEVLRKRDFNAFATAKAKLDSFQIESMVYQGQNTLTKLLEDKGDLKYIYLKEKDMLQAETNGDTSFQLSESDLEQLFTIQSKQSYAGAVAERVLTKLLDTNFIHPLPSLLANDTVPDINWEQYYNDYPVMIFPNPTEGFIRFEFDVPTPIETASIQIVKVSNPSTYVLVDDFTENFFSRVYDLSDKANGIYIMAIKVNGTIVTAKQFQINK